MVSCENDDQRKIANNTSDLKTPLEDTSAIIRADLPIEIDSLDYIFILLDTIALESQD